MGGVRRPSLLPLLEGDRPSIISRYFTKTLQIFSQIACTILFLPTELAIKTLRTAVVAGYVTLVHHPLVSLVSFVVLVQFMLFLWPSVPTAWIPTTVFVRIPLIKGLRKPVNISRLTGVFSCSGAFLYLDTEISFRYCHPSPGSAHSPAEASLFTPSTQCKP